MEVSIRARVPLRNSVKRTVSLIESQMKKTEVDEPLLSSLAGKLQDLSKKLAGHNEIVLNSMLNGSESDEKYEKECEEIEEYEDVIRLAILKVERFLQGLNEEARSSTGESSASVLSRRFRLPVMELKKFDGELASWLPWWSQFERIHSDPELHVSDKLHYLEQSMIPGSKAYRLVHRYPQTAENYPKVIEALRDRFGDKSMLAEVYIRNLQRTIMGISRARSLNELPKMYDELETQLGSLDSLEVTLDKSTFLVPLIEAGLPVDLLRVWQRTPESGYDHQDDTKKPMGSQDRLAALLRFLRREIKGEERIQLIQGQEEVKNKSLRGGSLGVGRNGDRCGLRDSQSPPTAQSLYVTSTECIFCDKPNHTSQDCILAPDMSLEERKEKVKQAHVCFKCLKKGHTLRFCRTPVRCVVCGKRHFPIMCEATITKNTLSSSPNQTDSVSNSSHTSQEGLVLMKTTLVRIKSENSVRVARLFFDEGSNKSYIRSRVAQELNCPVTKTLDLTTTLFGGKEVSQTKKEYEVEVASLKKQKFEKLRLLNEDKICGTVPKIPRGSWTKELESQGIYISDSVGSSPYEVDILIGSDLWAKLMTGRTWKLKCGLMAVESVFGWTLSGEIREQSIAMAVILNYCKVEQPLANLWDLETLGIKDPIEKHTQEDHDRHVKEEFRKNVTRDDEGRYLVKLPWIDRNISLPTNKGVAMKRLAAVSSRLRNQGTFTTYDLIFDDWLKEGFIEKTAEMGSHEHFLPHRPVFKPDSTTTPVRPVFDASCCTASWPSLNKCMEKGPNLLEVIPAILWRFRERRIGIIADIRKAFMMIGVHEDDRVFLKFLWWTKDDKIKILQHCRVVFGMNCSPFILAAVLDLHLSSVTQNMKKTAETLQKCLYVDNCVTSVDTEREFREFKSQAVKILADAKMDLREWESSIDADSLENSTTVLGLLWNKKSDTIYCRIPTGYKIPGKITKREVLSLTAQIFDPIGFTGPAVLKLKLLLQSTWSQNLGWDEELNQGDRNTFIDWINNLRDMETIRIPRYVGSGKDADGMELHLFADASQLAYAAAVFIKVTTDGCPRSQLLAAKSRLAPLSRLKKKKTTIPRLELMACLIGSRLLREIISALDYQAVPIFCWSDSTTALAWIRREEDWGTFVGNRVREINIMVPKENWRHVPGELNPADLPSRGCSIKDLAESRWWEGPTWLKKGEEHWPVSAGECNEEMVSAELKKSAAVNLIQSDTLRFSSYLKNLRVFGWICRFTKNVRMRADKREFNKNLTAEEVVAGERYMLKNLQKQSYSKGHKHNLSTIIGEDGLLRIKTRLCYEVTCSDFKFPILLPGNHPLVIQLVELVHKTYCHAGTQFVLNKLREKYWVTQGRRTVQKVIRKCTVCRRYTSKPMAPGATPPLPKERITTSYSFETTGVDLAGPIYLKGNDKVWVVIYTCATFRGVYFDLVDSLSTKEFIISLRKFVCVMGRPSTLFSDHGTNFVGADSLMREWRKTLEDDAVPIKWKFNPPTAAWWGGWWERLIRTLKDLLRRMIGRAKLTRKELEVCLCEAAYVMNERPLTVLNEDPEDLRPLTPSMFMKDLPASCFPELDCIGTKGLQDHYRRLVTLKEALKARFRREYLSMLISRPGKRATEPPIVGDVVLVGSDDKKRFEWPLGRIQELIPGRDGIVRVCKVKTRSGVLLRPIQRLYPLEMKTEETIAQEDDCSAPAPAKNSTDQEPAAVDPEASLPLEAKQPPLMTTRKGRVIRAPYYSSWKH